MFYSETLLSKTGPLARVWLSANLERKLSKSHILQSNIETSVGAIVGQDQAPMALRLSGQLLLGVVRIYSRKARYLLEDCNEALMKIKMAFRPGNVDLPTNATIHNTAQLTLPDAITELDLLLPDPTLDLGDLDMGDDLPLGLDPKHTARGKITLDDDDTLYIDSQPRGTAIDSLMMETELDLDLGEDFGMPSNVGRSTRGKDFSELMSPGEIGRDAPLEHQTGIDIFGDSNMSDLGLEEPSKARIKQPKFDLEDDSDLGINIGLDDDMGMGIGGDLGLGGEGDTTIQPIEAVGEKTPVPEEAPAPMEIEAEPVQQEERERSDSPLSSVRSSVERDITGRIEEVVGEPGDVTFVEQAGREATEDIEDLPGRSTTTRKRKPMIDSITEIKAKQIKAQQEDRSRILREPSFLARDPRMLALMSIATNGTIAHTIFRPRTINMDLANLLSPDFVARMAETKLKRDSGHLEEDESEVSAGRARKQPRLDIPVEDVPKEVMVEQPELQIEEPSDEVVEMVPIGAEIGDVTMPSFGGEEFDLPQIREVTSSPQPEIHAQGEESIITQQALEDLPPLPPTAISRETRNAVHVLREQFSEPNPKKAVVFQELLPEQSTTRIDATKLFFEVLVLATKDALNVKQSKGFGNIEIGQKQALWGAWAEEKDEQQVAEEAELEAEKEKEMTSTAAGRRPRRDVVVGVPRGEASGAA